MAWPVQRINGFIIDATAWNEVVAALSAWGGPVNAGGNSLANLGVVSFHPAGRFNTRVAIGDAGGPADSMLYVVNEAGNTSIALQGAGGSLFWLTAQSAANGTRLLIGGNAGSEPAMAPIAVTNGGYIGFGALAPWAKATFRGTTGSPSLTSHAAGGVLALNIEGGVELDFGFYAGSPYAAWMQTRHDWSDGLYYPIALNPLGGDVGIGGVPQNGKLHVQGGNLHVGGFNNGTEYGIVFSPRDGGGWYWMANIGGVGLQMGPGSIGSNPYWTMMGSGHIRFSIPNTGANAGDFPANQGVFYIDEPSKKVYLALKDSGNGTHYVELGTWT